MPEIQGRTYMGHAYWLVDGRKTPSPSKIKLDSPYLDRYHATEAVDAILDSWDTLTAISEPSMRRKTMEPVILTRYSYAAERGRECHRIMEALVNGQPTRVGDPEIITDPILAARLRSDPTIDSDATAAARALEAFRITPVWTEQPIINTRYWYTGTCDLVATSPTFDTDQPTILDYKFTKTVWPDYALQQSAYTHATHVLIRVENRGPRGGKLPDTWEYEPIESLRVDRAYVLNTRDGVSSMHPVVTDGEVWKAVQAWVVAYWAFQPKEDNPILDPILPSSDDTPPF